MDNTATNIDDVMVKESELYLAILSMLKGLQFLKCIVFCLKKYNSLFSLIIRHLYNAFLIIATVYKFVIFRLTHLSITIC